MILNRNESKKYQSPYSVTLRTFRSTSPPLVGESLPYLVFNFVADRSGSGNGNDWKK
jgi:hypothetical protein